MGSIPGLPFIMLSVAAHMMIFGALTPVMALYAQSFSVAEWQIGLMVTVFAVGRLAADIPAGHAAGRFGLRHMLWAGPAIVAVGSLVGAWADSFWQVLLGRGMQGVGSGIYMTAATVFCAKASDRRSRGKVMALFQGALLIGAAAGPTLGGFAAGALGYAGPFLAAAAIGGVTAVLAPLLFREEPKGVGRAKGAGAPTAALLLLLPFACVLLVNFALFLTRTAAQWQMMPLLAVERFAIGPAEIGLSLSLSALANLAVLPLAGHLVDVLPRVWIVVVSVLAAALALMAIVVAPSPLVLYGAMVAMGAATGLGGPALAAHAVDIVPEDAQGPAMGVMRFAGDLGYLVGPLSLGLLVDMAVVGHAGAITVNAALLGVAGLMLAVQATLGRPRKTLALATPPQQERPR